MKSNFYIGVIMHYIVIESGDESVSFIILETLKSICFFSVFYHYCKKSTGVLPNKKKWMKLFTALLFTSLFVEVTGIFYFTIHFKELFKDAGKICLSPIFLVLRGGSYIMIFVFLGIAISISRKVKIFVKEAK